MGSALAKDDVLRETRGAQRVVVCLMNGDGSGVVPEIALDLIITNKTKLDRPVPEF